jgi:hypothetical protein
MSDPIEVQYFYKTRWGHHDEWVELFLKNHWPILRAQMAEGRYSDVRMAFPRFHGDGLAGWDVMVSITYKDWASMQEHAEPGLVERLYPDQATFRAEEARRFEILEAHWDVVLEERPLP